MKKVKTKLNTKLTKVWNQETLTPDFVGVDFTIEIKVWFDEDLADWFPLKLFVWKPDGLEQHAVRNDDDDEEHDKVAHLNHLQTDAINKLVVMTTTTTTTTTTAISNKHHDYCSCCHATSTMSTGDNWLWWVPKGLTGKLLEMMEWDLLQDTHNSWFQANKQRRITPGNSDRNTHINTNKS